MSKTACIYVRVSDQRQVKGTSIEMQEAECLKWCGENGYAVAKVFVEPGVSAKSANRRVLKEMMNYIKVQPKGTITAVVVWKFDRFTRNFDDGLTLRKELTERGVEVLSATEKTDNSAEGKFIGRIHDATSELDNSRRSQRSQSGMRYRFSQGRYQWKAPTGYLNGRPGEPSLVTDPDRCHLIKRLFELVASGHSRAQALREVTALGLRSIKGNELPSETRDHILRNPLYMGEMHGPKWGMIVKGDFEPIVSPALFQTVQEVMDGKRRVHPSHKSEREEFPLKGLVICEHCLLPVTAANAKGKFPYYRCHRTPGHLNVRAEKVERDFVALLDALVPCAAQEAAIEAVFREVWLSKLSTSKNEATRLRSRISKLEARKVRALEQKVDGELTAEEYKMIRSATDSEVMELTERLRVTESRTLDLDAAAAYLRHTLWNTSHSWQVADFKGKRSIQGRVFPKGIVYKPEGFWNPVTSPLYSMLGDETREIRELVGPEGFEPPTKGL